MGHSLIRSPHSWQVPWPHMKIMFFSRSRHTGHMVCTQVSNSCSKTLSTFNMSVLLPSRALDNNFMVPACIWSQRILQQWLLFCSSTAFYSSALVHEPHLVSDLTCSLMSWSCCCSFCTSALTLVFALSFCRAGMFPLAVWTLKKKKKKRKQMVRIKQTALISQKISTSGNTSDLTS